MAPISVNPDLVYREESDRGLLFDPGSGGIAILNATAGFIYRLIQGGATTRDEIVNQLMRAFEVQDRSSVERDVDEFLTRLEGSRMLSPSGREPNDAVPAT